MQGDSSELPQPFETQGTPYATKHLRAAALIGGRADSLTALQCSRIRGTALMIPDLHVYSQRLYAR